MYSDQVQLLTRSLSLTLVGYSFNLVKQLNRHQKYDHPEKEDE